MSIRVLHRPTCTWSFLGGSRGVRGQVRSRRDADQRCGMYLEGWRWSRLPVQGRRHHTTTHEQAVPACGGSGDEQAKAKLCRVEIDEVVVAFDPPT
jgi:hypothetical protein